MKVHRELSKLNAEHRLIQEALSSLNYVNSLVHRVKLSGSYNFRELQHLLGRMRIDETYPTKNANRMPNYLRKSYLNIDGQRMTVFTKPTREYLPRCILDITSPSVYMLNAVGKKLTEVKLSYIELAIDFVCGDCKSADLLLYLFKRYLYIPFVKRIWPIGDEEFDFEIPSTINTGVSYTSKRKGSQGKYVRLYQRVLGLFDIYKADGKPYCDHEDVLVLRLEICHNRGSSRLRKLQLNTLTDLLYSPSFKQIVFPDYTGGKSEIRFVNFKKHDHLPQLWEDYMSESKDGVSGVIQQEILTWRDTYNVFSYLQDSKHMKPVTRLIENALIELECRWISDLNS